MSLLNSDLNLSLNLKPGFELVVKLKSESKSKLESELINNSKFELIKLKLELS